MKNFLTTVACSMFMLVGYILNGYIIMNLWEWFVMPVWPALPALSLKHAIGLSFVLALFKNHDTVNKFSELPIAAQFFMYCIMQPAIIMFLGFMAHCFL